jgi:hypothetical protein
MAIAMNGPRNTPNPDGIPRFRRVILVRPADVVSHVYVVSTTSILPDLPTVFVVGFDGRPPQPLRPDVLAQFRSLQAAWYPGGVRVSIWGTDQHGDMKFLNVPMDTGEVTSSKVSEAVQRNLAGITVRRFVWAKSRGRIYFEGSGGRQHECLAHFCGPVDRTIDGRAGASDDRNRARVERCCFARREEDPVHLVNHGSDSRS